MFGRKKYSLTTVPEGEQLQTRKTSAIEPLSEPSSVRFNLGPEDKKQGGQGTSLSAHLASETTPHVDPGSRNERSLRDADRESMEKLFAPHERFNDIIRMDERGPEVFVPADTHHFDDQDYRNHRHRNYPHMHQPLKSMEPRLLRRLRRRMDKHKEVEQEAADAGVPSDVPEQLAKIAMGQKKRGGKKHPTKQKQKRVPFEPALGQVKEEAGHLSTSSVDVSSNEELESDDELGPDERRPSLSDSEQTAPREKRGIPHYQGEPSLPSTMSAPQLSFLEEIQSEAHPMAFLELTGTVPTAIPLPFDADNEQPAESTAEGQEELGSHVGSSSAMRVRQISFADEINKLEPGAKTDDKPTFVVGVDENAEPIPKARKVSRHHSERYNVRDLSNRTCSGSDLRKMAKDDSSATAHDDIEGLNELDTDNVKSHRCEDVPAMCRHRIHKSFSTLSASREQISPESVPDSKAKTPDLFPQHSSASDLGRHFLSIDEEYPLMVQMNVLKGPSKKRVSHWHEQARWICFEEDYNDKAHRFDPAHSSPLKFHALLQFRRYLEQGTVILGLHSDGFVDMVEEITRRLKYDGSFTTSDADESFELMHLLFLPHIRAGEHYSEVQQFVDSISGDPDGLRRRGSYSSEEGHPTRKKSLSMTKVNEGANPESSGLKFLDNLTSAEPLETTKNRKISVVGDAAAARKISLAKPWMSSTNFRDHQKSHPIEADPHVHERKRLHHKMSFFHRSRPHFKSDLEGRLVAGMEGAAVLVGALADVTKPTLLLVRIGGPGMDSHGMFEMDIPMRFLFLFICPMNDEVEYVEIGRVMATMLIDENFRRTAFAAKNKDDLLEGVRLFLDNSVVLPITSGLTARSLGLMHGQIKAYKAAYDAKMHSHVQLAGIENLQHGDNLEEFHVVLSDGKATLEPSASAPANLGDKTPPGGPVENKHGLVTGRRTCLGKCSSAFCPPFIYVYRDLKAYCGRFTSDFKDAFTKENVSTTFLALLFIYFTALAPAITFGALMNSLVSPEFTITMSILGSGLPQVMFALFGGQPLLIVGITGPLFIMETSISLAAESMNENLSSLRFWVAIYTAMLGLVIIACNLVVVVQYIRRSVEEVFNSFVGLYFILKALFTMIGKIPPPLSTVSTANRTVNATIDPVVQKYFSSMAEAGTTFFLAFIMLLICYMLAQLKTGRYFRRKIRNLLGSFNVPIGIMVVVIIERVFFSQYHISTLNIPSGNTDVTRWVHMPNWYNLMYGPASSAAAHGFAFGIALCMVLLIATETAVAGVTVAKAERKLVKPCLFAQDFLVCLVIFPIISGVLGWPFVTGAVVRSNSHVIALTKWDQKVPPGMPHKIIGCAEQRFTGLMVGLFVALSIFLGAILHYIPMAAMYGMFLFMGVMGLRDLQLVRRLFALCKRKKHWGDWDYLRNLPSRHILVFSLIQGSVVALLVAMNCVTEFANISYTSLIFPAILVSYALCREFLMPCWPWLNRHLEQLDRKHPIVLQKATTSVKQVLSVENFRKYSMASTSQPVFDGQVNLGGPDMRVKIDPSDDELTSDDESAWERHADNPYSHV